MLTWSGSEGKRYNPITWWSIFKAAASWARGHRQLAKTITDYNIDMIHLNSVSLSNAAAYLNEVKFPFVWHVREHGPSHQGMRYKFIQNHLKASAEVIFLSKAEQYSWIGNNDHGTVVHNFIDLQKFSYDLEIDDLKEKYAGSKVILYVGGFHKFKGIEVLVEALKEIKADYGDKFVCIMPGAKQIESKQDKYYRTIISTIDEKGLVDQCEILPFSSNIVELFAASDVLVFPATTPHFARPVIEAGAMKKPAVASNLKAIDELVVHGETGYLCKPEDAADLAQYILRIFRGPDLAKEMGENGLEFAKQEFEYNNQMKKITNIFDRLLK